MTNPSRPATCVCPCICGAASSPPTEDPSTKESSAAITAGTLASSVLLPTAIVLASAYFFSFAARSLFKLVMRTFRD
ncbi:hypothetical protein H696_01524 [Fonticula alba]|uniref:Uncharacterized protein n=1 Tax=Fonticula alba TaxID=691883 RepID=A0A058ZDW7_FONAL|nr:hypothetical protein H696_01524 [Fonticula alba]KCV72118.1 hypothetical protein H696_01524 [Fonticula alba]|eukprot:XP_009493696.1 hypothetical protein H696_01524 [Fonticula alba]